MAREPAAGAAGSCVRATSITSRIVTFAVHARQAFGTRKPRPILLRFRLTVWPSLPELLAQSVYSELAEGHPVAQQRCLEGCVSSRGARGW
jgi:hypothetical protein